VATRLRRIGARIVAGVLVAAASSAIAAAQTPNTDLLQISIEGLMNVQITSASRKEQRAADTAAAVYVITSEDILRSGITILPELFRLTDGTYIGTF
jgi:iron complex outermembrane receptor protein